MFNTRLIRLRKALEEQLVPIPVRLNKELMNELDAEEQQQMLKLLQKVVAQSDLTAFTA
ncbi:hypothetical protein AB6E77_01240 [Vibrio sp. 10N.247.311.18]|uniref:hypothetical protein n=1 Tax=unclassified Vibrio TaxID=2614977 RepID=UPI00354AF11D